ncbi:MAG: hypothetical protein IJ324_11580 [Lachnospiraceae bacterium]|nr:hypothetical protein [Lachnospiraceae bacterium]
MHDFRCEKPGEMYHQALRDVAKYFKETQEGQQKMCQIWDEVRQEGIESALKAFVMTKFI